MIAEAIETKKLGDVCDVFNGSTPSRSQKDYWENGTINWFTVDDIRNQGRVITETKQKVTDEGLESTSMKLLPPETVLVCCTASVGEYAITEVELTTNQQFNGLVIKDREQLSPKYLYHFASTLKDQLISVSGKTTINFVSMTKLKNVEIPIPPLPEQERIVAKLDTAFAAIDQAKTNVEQNLHNAKELFQSKLNEVFRASTSSATEPPTSSATTKADPEPVEGWVEKPLGEVIKVLNGYAFRSKEAIEDSNTQLLRMSNLYKNKLDLGRSPVFYPDSYAVEYNDYVLQEGDMIMSLTGTVGKTDYGFTVRISDNPVTLLLNQRLMKIELLTKEVLNKDYLHNYLLSPDFLERLYETANGTRQANLSSRTILTLKIRFPKSFEKQIELVELISKVKEASNQLQTHYTQKLAELEELKKSLLERAFKGEI